jgi:hypothetical protein
VYLQAVAGPSGPASRLGARHPQLIILNLVALLQVLTPPP